MESAPQKIPELMWAHGATRVLLASVDLGVYSAIRGGNTTAESIAKVTRASMRGIRMLLDALVGLGLLSKTNANYQLAPEAETYLINSSPMFLGPMMEITKRMVEDWAHLLDAARTGKPISTQTDQESAAFFAQLVRGLFPLNYPIGKFVAERRLLGPVQRVLDVALGSAAWSIPLAQTEPEIRVTGIDFPEVLDVTRVFLERYGVTPQFSLVAGNLREIDFGRAKFDLVILGHICHSEGEDGSRDLFRKSHRALVSGGKVFIAEFIPNDTRTGPPQPLIFALNMLLHTGAGQTFTLQELSGMLKDAGFKTVKTLDAPAPSPLIVAEK